MNTTDDSQPVPAPSPAGPPAPMGVVKKLGIWCLFLAILYLARDFFFTAFMTFLFCYLTLAVVGWAMKRLSPGEERLWLRRLLTVGVFLLTPLILLGVGALFAPRLIEQGHCLGGWLSQVNPETETARLLEDFVGPMEFKREYGGPDDERYHKALAEFAKQGERHVEAYNSFPHLEAWIEGSFAKSYTEAEKGRVRSRLMREGTSSKEFEHWFLTEKVPELQAQARKQVPEKGRPSSEVSPLVRSAASSRPEQLLLQIRHDPATLAELRQEWINDTVEKDVAAARKSPAYREQLSKHYEHEREKSPRAIPYTFEEYIELQKVRPEGRRAFGDAVEKLRPTAAEDGEARMQADFEAAKKHELFQHWWGTSSTARFVQQQVHGDVSGDGAARLERIITSLINVPLDLATALLLSIFICIDFPNLKRGFQRLRETWLREVYDEMVPRLASLAQLIGRSMHAQGLIALCNAVLIFIALRILGVEHEFLLSMATFVLCLVPTLGAAIALVMISLFALVQFGGGPILALKAAGAVVLVMVIESFVLSPRILGKMMELHPVLSIAILPVAQYFFGVWGLILAIPVAVYVIHVLILRRGLPGSEERHDPAVASTEHTRADAQEDAAPAVKEQDIATTST
jgi:predicted PurR-regulated permease PerM